jgi:hypothetical protein
MAGVSLQDRVRIPDCVMFQRVDTEMAVVNTDTGVYFGLDEVGTRAWELLAEDGRLQAVAERMLAEFDVEPQRLEADLLRLVDELLANGLVERTLASP